MKRILVPCDFSDPAVQAFKLAAEIARQSNGEVFLLNVVEVPVMHETVIMPTLYFEQSFMTDMKANAEKKFGKMIEKWASEGPKTSFRVEFGPTSATIRQFIDERDIDLVVMGTHGASGAKEFLIGSNTEKIVRGSKVPVLTIKKATKLSSIKDIVFANDIDLDAEELTLKVKELQNFFKAKLHVLYVNTPGSFRRDLITSKAMKDFAKRFMLKNFTLNIYNDIDQESGVRNFVQSINADLVAMSTHGRRGLNHFLTGSIAEDVVNHLERPIWTYRSQQ